LILEFHPLWLHSASSLILFLSSYFISLCFSLPTAAVRLVLVCAPLISFLSAVLAEREAASKMLSGPDAAAMPSAVDKQQLIADVRSAVS
jgi:hypothetical protein